MYDQMFHHSQLKPLAYQEITPSLTVIEITMNLWTPDVITTTQSTALPQSIPVSVCI